MRYRSDMNFKIAKNLRNRMNKVIQGINKSESTLALLGVKTVGEVRRYLEAQFSEGMSWSNHNFGGWHIDHLIPLVSFDLTDPIKQKEAFRYTNLQPMWAGDNLRKGKKLKDYQVKK